MGRFEAADGGTLFLDEIGNIPMEVQEKILRVVEYNTFERVGSSESIDVDVRIIAATNADVLDLVARNLFKEDLLDRLSFEVLVVPPLRNRGEDILLLANYFAGRMAVELEWEEIPHLNPEAVRALERHHWPGNIRELKNVVERAVYRSQSITISEIVFDPFAAPYQRKRPDPETGDVSQDESSTGSPDLMTRPLKEAVWELKVQMLENALQQAKFNQKKAAQILGLTYHQFRGLYRQYKEKKIED
jgi:psp operon transcriptional activator